MSAREWVSVAVLGAVGFAYLIWWAWCLVRACGGGDYGN